MENNSTSSESIASTSPGMSRLFGVVRAIAIGLAASGFVLATVMYATRTPLPIAARGNMLGGALSVFAAIVLTLGVTLIGRKVQGLSKINWGMVLVFLFAGAWLFAIGYRTESANVSKMKMLKVNMENIKAAIENYEAGMVPSEKVTKP